MLSVTWSPRARRNLSSIVDYIGARNPDAAASLMRLIREHVHQLPNHPHIYREGRLLGTREMVVHPNYVVTYRIGMKTIEIIAIVHTRQDNR